MQTLKWLGSALWPPWSPDITVIFCADRLRQLDLPQHGRDQETYSTCARMFNMCEHICSRVQKFPA